MQNVFGKKIDTTSIRKNQYGNFRHVSRQTAERYRLRHGGKIFIFNAAWNYLTDQHGQPISFVTL